MHFGQAGGAQWFGDPNKYAHPKGRIVYGAARNRA
jgi:hypothetical protein